MHKTGADPYLEPVRHAFECAQPPGSRRTLTHQALQAWWPLSRNAGEGGERSEAGEGLAAVTHKIDQFSLHTGTGVKTVVQLSSEILL
jgi:hypothetical protein